MHGGSDLGIASLTLCNVIVQCVTITFEEGKIGKFDFWMSYTQGGTYKNYYADLRDEYSIKVSEA